MAAPHLIVGGDSWMGRALGAGLRSAGAEVLATSRRTASPQALHLDLAATPDSWALPDQVDAAFLFSAVTSLAACRQDPEGTRRINVQNTLALAQRLLDRGAFVLFPSTNLVFDGEQPFCAAEAPRSPRGVYGRHKAEAEEGLLALGGNVAVLRMTKVVGPDIPLFTAWARDLRAGQPVFPFHDMVMAPLPLALVLRAFCALAEARAPGIWQVSAQEDIPYARAAGFLCRRLGADPGLVRPISWRDRPGVEEPPRHTTLDPSRLQQAFGITSPRAEDSLNEVFRSLE